MMERLVDLRSFRVEEPSLPEDIGALRLLQMVYRGEIKASPQQMRAAIECLSFENPKLTAVAVASLDAQDFASRLERALQRTDAARWPKLIEARVNNEDEP